MESCLDGFYCFGIWLVYSYAVRYEILYILMYLCILCNVIVCCGVL